MPKTYDSDGLHFLYPDNWSVDEEEPEQGGRMVTVQSPGGAFWSITLHPVEMDPQELAQAALAALEEEYPQFEVEPANERIGERTLEGFDFRFFYLDFVSVACIRSFRTPAATCLVLWQAEDRDYEQLGAVFRAISTSALGSM